MSEVVRNLTKGVDGSLLGTDGDRTLRRIRFDRETGDYRAEVVWQAPEPITTLVESPTSGLWISVGDTLYHRGEAGLEPVPLPGPGSGAIVGFREDPDGRLWALRDTGVLYHQEGREWVVFLPPSAPNEHGTPGFTLSPDGTVWVACRSRELRCLRDGQWRHFRSPALNLPRGAMGIVSDEDGGLWWATHAEGVFHLDAATARALAAGDVNRGVTVQFGRADGLESLAGAGYNQTPLRDPGGRIWWPTARGVSVLDPATWRAASIRAGRPRVRLETVALDGETAALSGATPRLELPVGTERLEIRCSIVDLSAPERVYLQYRLVGYDNDWAPAGERTTAFYQRLPPGVYPFEARAANQFMQWSDPSLLVTVVVVPHWWQTASFRVLGGAAIVGLLWLSRWVQVRRWRRNQARREEFARQLIQSQETERARIAGELHDSLGQSLLIAKNQLFLAQEVAGDHHLQPRLDQVARGLTEALEEARAISHRLRPFQLERLGLTRTLQALVKQVSESTGIPIEAQIDPLDGRLSAEAEVMVYRILQEALSNVVKHADASQLRVRFERGAADIRLTVEDDGRGFDAASLLGAEGVRSGMGLSSFEERTRLLGGRFTCRSAPGEGTTLTFEFPLPESAPR